MKKLPIPTIVTALFLVIVLVFYAITFQVRFNEVAVKVRLGKADAGSIISGADAPGLYPRWPWPVEQIVKYDRRLHVLDTPEGEIKTSDNMNVLVGCFAIWRIADPLTFHVRCQTERKAEDLLRQRVNEARAAIIGRHAMTEFVNLAEAQVQQAYDRIEDQILGEVAKPAAKDFGIELVRVGIRRISLPAENTKKVFEAMIQERNTLAAQFREEGKGRQKAIEADAESKRRAILAFADRRAQEIIAEGIQATTRILEEIRNPEDQAFFNWLRRLEAMQAALAQRTTIFLDARDAVFSGFDKPELPNQQSDRQLEPGDQLSLSAAGSNEDE